MAAVLVGFNSFIDLHPEQVSQVVVAVGGDMNSTRSSAECAERRKAAKAAENAHDWRNAQHSLVDLPQDLYRRDNLYRFYRVLLVNYAD